MTKDKNYLMSKLRVEGLGVHYLGPIDLMLDEGSCTCISGVSGAGKTLLLRALADMDEHTGDASLDGVACHDINAPDWRRQIVLLAAENPWWYDTVGQHFDGHEIKQTWLSDLGLTPSIMDSTVTRLSSGERQRLALLRLLSRQPKVLLLDEPTHHLDTNNIKAAEQLIHEYCKQHKAPVLWVSHDPEQIARVADRHYVLEQGKLTETRSVMANKDAV